MRLFGSIEVKSQSNHRIINDFSRNSKSAKTSPVLGGTRRIQSAFRSFSSQMYLHHIAVSKSMQD